MGKRINFEFNPSKKGIYAAMMYTCKCCGQSFFRWRMKNDKLCIDCFRKEVKKNGRNKD